MTSLLKRAVLVGSMSDSLAAVRHSLLNACECSSIIDQTIRALQIANFEFEPHAAQAAAPIIGSTGTIAPTASDLHAAPTIKFAGFPSPRSTTSIIGISLFQLLDSFASLPVGVFQATVLFELARQLLDNVFEEFIWVISLAVLDQMFFD